LKTDNILLNDQLVGKISDFGISKYLNQNISSTMTQKGTPVYQSPEQFPQKDKPFVGTPADVYCFGSIVYHVIFEFPPWTLENVSTFDELYKLVVLDQKRPMIPTNKEFDNEFYKLFIKIIEDCWIHKQENRPSFNKIMDILLDNENNIDFDIKIDYTLIRFENLDSNMNEDIYNKIDVVKGRKKKTIINSYIHLTDSKSLELNENLL
jgi:serine/threonine protein kinase